MIVCEKMQKLRKMLDEKRIEWHDNSEVMSERKSGPCGFAEHTLTIKA